MYITSIKRTKEEKTRSGNSIWWLLSEEIGVPNFELRYFEIKRGMSTSYDKHSWEHEVYVVKGKGIVRGRDLEGKVFEEKIKSGDAIYVAVNEEHQFWNYGNQPLAFICIIPKGTEERSSRDIGLLGI